MFDAYSKKDFWKSLLGLVLMSVLMKFTRGTGFAVVAMISFFAMITGKTKLMLYCLILANCALMGNSWFFPKNFLFGIAHRGMLILIGICLSVKVFGGSRHKVLTPFLWILPYMFYMILPSLQGWEPIVSMLKIFLFVTIFVAYVGSAKMAIEGREDAGEYRGMILGAITFFVLGSLLIIPFPGISYMGTEELLLDPNFAEDIKSGRIVSLFKGMTWHSQTLGPLVSMFCVFLVGDLLFNVRKIDKLYLVLILVSPFLVYKTSSRTAMAVLICGVATEIFLFQNSRTVMRTWKSKIMSIAVGVFILMAIVAAAIPNVRDGIVRYAIKYGGENKVTFSTEEMMSTRQFLMDAALYNWRKKPLIGNGFQVSEKMMYEKRRGLKDYLTAPIEKGVWVTAVLEEGGIIGLLLFCLFWMPAVISLWSGRFYASSSMLLSFIILNMAEFVMFSMSGAGGFIWAIIFIMTILDGKRVMGDAQEAAIFRERMNEHPAYY